MTETTTCPRCLGPLDEVGRVSLEYPHQTLCAPCSSDEAGRVHYTGLIIPSSQWPVQGQNPHAYSIVSPELWPGRTYPPPTDPRNIPYSPVHRNRKNP